MEIAVAVVTVHLLWRDRHVFNLLKRSSIDCLELFCCISLMSGLCQYCHLNKSIKSVIVPIK